MNQSTLTLESLALPIELLWTGKTEPISPVSSELYSINELNDSWLLDYNFATGLPSLFDDADILEYKEIIEVTHDLTNGDDVVLELNEFKEEYLVDAKILDFPDGNNLVQPNAITKVITPLNTGDLNQFGFDVASLAQLTPPQSPPRNSAASSPAYPQTSHINEYRNNFDGAFPRILSPEPQSPERITISPTTFLTNPATTIVSNDVPNHFTFNWPTTPQTTIAAEPHVATSLTAGTSVHHHEDYERDLQLLDEIVNTRVKELPEWNAVDESETQSSFSGPSLSGSVISDDDWQPESCYSSSVSSPLYQHSSDEQNNLSADPLQTSSSDSLSPLTKKRTRQYGRGVEDRKIRKKEQNKNAATRYRQKKKVEMESVLIEEQKLIARNTELKRILAEAKREASYLKSLIREFNQNEKSL